MSEDLEPGDIVERYRVEAELGRGGMAVVYRVTHTGLSTTHALKVLLTDQESVRARLLDEGKLQASLNHPNILAVRDVLDVGGSPGLLMDYVSGGSLAEWLGEGGHGEAERRAVFEQVIAGVAHAHSQGMIHRDLKPANILLEPSADGVIPKIADFGLAKALGEADTRDHRTVRGTAMGTPAYMAPEQVHDASEADRRADLWALGVMLFELFVGERPFLGNTQAKILGRVLTANYSDPHLVRPDLDDHIASAIRGCLVRDPDARLQDCTQLSEVLAGEREVTATLPVTNATFADTGGVTMTVGPSQAPTEWADERAETEQAPVAPPEPVTESPTKVSASAASAARVRVQRAMWFGLIAVAPLVALTDLSRPIEGLVQYPVIRLARGELTVDGAVVVGFEGMRDPRQLRSQHAAVIDALVDAGATAIIVDVALITETEHDEGIAAAIARAAERRVPVIIPVFTEGIAPRKPESEALRTAGPLGLVEFQREMLMGAVVRAPLFSRTLDDQLFWHAAALGVHGHLGARRDIEIEGDELVIGGTRNATWAGVAWLHPVGDVPRVAYEAPDSWGEDIRGRVALIGSYGGSADLHRTPDGPRYGVEIQAALVQTLIRQAALEVVPLWVDAVLALLTGVLTVLVGWLLPRRRRLVAAVVPAGILAILIALVPSGIMAALIPVVLAALMAAVVINRSLREENP
jgi:serine/threonine-protein kinase